MGVIDHVDYVLLVKVSDHLVGPPAVVVSRPDLQKTRLEATHLRHALHQIAIAVRVQFDAGIAEEKDQR